MSRLLQRMETHGILTRRLLEICPTLPIIICTGYSESLDEEKALAIGARGLLPKPLEKAHLAEAVRQALDT